MKAEQQLSGRLSRLLRQHPIWPWLSQFPGLGGAHTALVIGKIGDPRRFPGQRCSEGHYLPPLYAAGTPCPIAGACHGLELCVGDGAETIGAADTPGGIEHPGGRSESHPGTAEHVRAIDEKAGCPGVMLPRRPGTGVRSVWHWAGLHCVDDGRAPRKRKGFRVTWDPRVRASVMQPGGIAEQIVRLNVPHYADIYREGKARLILRVAVASHENDGSSGGANPSGVAENPAEIDGAAGYPPNLRIAEHEVEIELPPGDANPLRAAEGTHAIDVPVGHPLRPQRTADVVGEIDRSRGRPLRLFEADRIARKVAAKAFLGDLLIEWKRICDA